MTTLVFVVDDDVSVRTSLVRLLRSAGYAVEAFASAREFLDRAASGEPEPRCLVLDVRMPGMTGLNLQQTLSTTAHRIPIVFVTGHGDIPMSVNAMKAGAVDFLTKPFDVESLLDAIGRAVTQDFKARGVEDRAAEILGRVEQLTARETEVFALVVTGMLNKQIAGRLGIAEKTVKVHRARVMQKMRANSVAELVRLADHVGVMAAPPARTA